MKYILNKKNILSIQINYLINLINNKCPKRTNLLIE